MRRRGEEEREEEERRGEERRRGEEESSLPSGPWSVTHPPGFYKRDGRPAVL